MAKILDYSFARPDPASIKDQGFIGVVRYVSPNPGKNLTIPERDALRAAGLAIGLVWEWYAQRPLEGEQAGIEDARAALNQAAALGFPAYLPIYFAVDWDATEQQQGPINAYFQGVRSVFAGRKVGAYAGFYPLKRLFDAGLISHGWQTYAWSGGRWDNRAQLRQTLNGQWNGSVDFGETMADDHGLWTVEQQAQPAPEPKPAPAPNGSHDYQIQKNDTFWGLEEQNHWTHGTLQNMNPGIEPTKLAIGQTIRIPGSVGNSVSQPISQAPSTSKHTIVAGDTFWGLETSNNWPHGTLQGLNPGVNYNALQIGSQINIPGGVVGSEPAPAVQQTRTYKIVKGDTFWALETANGWGHGTLQGLNPGVDPTKLQIGQSITIPS